jgi:hypothetical protein
MNQKALFSFGVAVLLMASAMLLLVPSLTSGGGNPSTHFHADGSPTSPFVVVATGLYSISLSTTSGDTLIVAIFGSSGISDTEGNSWTLQPSSCNGFSYIYTATAGSTGPDTISTPGLAPYSAAWAVEVITGTILAQGTSGCSAETASPGSLGSNAVAIFTSVNQGGAACPTTGGTAWIFACQDTASTQGWGGFSQNVTASTSPVLSTNTSTGGYFLWLEIPQQPVAPGAPTSLSGVAPTQTTTDLVWVNPSGTVTDSYVNQYAGGACGGAPTVHNIGSAVSSTTVTGLTANTTYGFTVSAANAAGQGPASACVLVQTPPYNTKVVVPPFLSAAAISQTSITLTWTASVNVTVTNYELEYGTVYGTYGTSVAESTALHATITSLTANTTYFFIIVPNAGPSSNVAPAHTFAYNEVIQTAPVLVASAVSQTSVLLEWTTPANFSASQYYAYWNSYADSAGPLSGNSYTVTGLTANTTYSFVIIPYTSGFAQGPLSNFAPAHTFAYNPAVVSFPVLSVVAVSQTSVDLAWTAPANVTVTNYTVEFGTSFGTYPTHLSEGAATFDATVTGLTANTTYWFIVQTWTGASTKGPVSNAAPAQTLNYKTVMPPVVVAPVLSVSSYSPTPLNPISSGDNPFTVLNWTAAQNVTVTSYTLYATPYGPTNGPYATWSSNIGGFKTIEGNVHGNVTQLVNWNSTYEFVVCTNTGLCSNVLLYNEPTIYPVAEVASVTATTQTSANVTWNTAQNFVYDTNAFTGGFLTWSVANYTLLWGTVYGVWTGSQSEGPVLHAAVNGLTANQSYYFAVEVWFTNHNDVGTQHLVISNFALAHTKDYAPVIPPAGCSLSNLAQCPSGGLPSGFWTDDFIIIIVVSTLTMLIGLMLARRDDATDES